jgi:dihydroorotate dehydrogenase (NAD+) catalytic subunit
MCAQPLALADLSCRIAGVHLANPFVLASGIWGTSPALLERAARAGAGAVTAKTCTPAPRRGHRNPTAVDWRHGLINAMGLPNPGVAEEVGLLREAARRLAPLGVPLIASISADSPDDFVAAAVAVAGAGPALIELNISCPNVQAEHGEMFASSATAAAAVTRAVKAAVSLPIIVKLSPNVPDIAALARAVVQAGANAITAINTMPGMLVDPESGRPVLANGSGGISGPALNPIALRCVYEIARAVTVPIIGTGGVTEAVDAVTMLSVGATGVGVGSAIYHRGPDAFSHLVAGLEAWCEQHGVSRLEEIRGRALAAPHPRAVTNPPPFPAGGPTHG